jgi:hypothetical protein
MNEYMTIYQEDEYGVWIFSNNGIKLGISSQCEWVIYLRNAVYFLKKPEDMIFLLPILEMGRVEFYTHVEYVLHNNLKLIASANFFPESLLLHCSFELSSSDYWPLKGLDWLEAMPNPFDNFEVVLCDLHNRTGSSQMLKQRILRFFKKSQIRIYRKKGKISLCD